MDKNGEWREATLGDKFCNPPKKTDKKFNVGCKVKDHSGALAEGAMFEKFLKN